ncbi:sugar-binding transcriptional regulator [Rouxiella sp. S1S-2]|uniref:sugar-binding transcriptional regulator n=1 Tax=Rouxiella sp. S1S-2 TaxID=2653856 RepID=UPI001D016031|nr:sugar-binding domain-containing protein [Rouxiella sp. S1S-2]
MKKAVAENNSKKWLSDNPKYIYSFVAKKYFSEMKTKSEIADEMGISRFKVARLIAEAIENEYVKFVFPKQQALDEELAQNICNKYSLNDAVVLSMIDSYGDRQLLTDKLGIVTANYLSDHLKQDMKVGIAWGRVLSSTVSTLRELPPLHVVQLAGVHPKIEFSQSPIDLIHKIASISNGKAYPIYLPMWVDDENVARQIANDQFVAEARRFYTNLDVIITGIGAWKSGSSSLFNIFPDEWREGLLAHDVCADICTTFIDSKGKVIESPIDKLGFGISHEQIKKTNNVIGVAGGEDKYEAVLASLRSGILDTLITDFDTAVKLMDEN